MKIFYIRNRHGLGVGCLATSINKETGVVYFGVSSYNKKDKFSKAEARKQAIDRLESAPRMVALSSERGQTRKTILKRLIQLHQEGYKPVSHTVAEAAKHLLQWQEVTNFWKQWEYKYGRSE